MDDLWSVLILATLAAMLVRALWRELLEVFVIVSIATLFAGLFGAVWMLSSLLERR